MPINGENVGPTHGVSIGLSEQFKTRANEDVQVGVLVSSGAAARGMQQMRLATVEHVIVLIAGERAMI
jgi:hypothetical protein